MLSILLLRLKLMITNKKLLLICFIIPIIVLLITGKTLERSNENLKLSIAVVDEDNSRITRETIKKISKNELFIVKESNFEAAEKMLLRDDIEGVYVFKKGFEKNIKIGKTDNLVQVHYLQGNYIAPAVTDIITSNFMFDIVTEKTKLIVEDIIYKEDSNKSQEFNSKFNERVQTIHKDEEYVLPIITEYMNSAKQDDKNSQVKKLMKNNAVNIILIFIMLAVLMNSIYTRKDYNTQIITRIKISSCTYLKYTVGNIMGISIPVIITTLIQILLIKVFILKDVNALYLMFIFSIYIISFTIFALLLVNIFKSIQSIQAFIPYIILILYILGSLGTNISILPTYTIQQSIFDYLLFNDYGNILTNLLYQLINTSIYFIAVIATGYKEYQYGNY